MIVLQIFLALLWTAAVVGALAGGVWSVITVARWSGTTRGTRASGMAIYVLATCAALALLIGMPLTWMGWV